MHLSAPQNIVGGVEVKRDKIIDIQVGRIRIRRGVGVGNGGA